MLLLFSAFPSYAASWPQYLGPSRTGCTPQTIPPEAVDGQKEPVQRWRVSTGAGQAQPIVVDGAVYSWGVFDVGSDPRHDAVGSTPENLGSFWSKQRKEKGGYPYDAWLTAVDLHAGEVKWRTQLSKEELYNDQCPPHASPLYYDGKVFIHTPEYLIAINAETGEIVWKHHLPEKIDKRIWLFAGFSAPIEAQGQIIVSYARNEENDFIAARGKETALTAFNPEGAVLWTHTLGGEDKGFAPSMASPSQGVIDGKHTIVQTTGHATVGVDASTGDRLWMFRHSDHFPDLLESAANVDPETGKINRPGFWWRRYGQTNPAALVSEDGIVVDRVWSGHGTRGSRMYGFEVRDGEPSLLWETQELLNRWDPGVIDQGRYYGIDMRGFTHMNNVEQPRHPRPKDLGQIQCYDLATGKLVWSSNELPQNAGLHQEEPRRGKSRLTPENWAELPKEHIYNYGGGPTFTIAGGTFVLRGNQASGSGLLFARITDDGLQRLGAREFVQGNAAFGKPVVAAEHILLKLDDETRGGPEGSGNLICFDLKPQS